MPELVVEAPLILVGDIKKLYGHDHEAVFRLFKVTVHEILKGDMQGPEVYLVDPPPADFTAEGPPILFPGTYILFLDAVENELAAATLSELEGTGKRPDVYMVYGGWRGAVSADANWPEMSNRAIEAEYGRMTYSDIKTAVQSACGYLEANSAERKQLEARFRGKGRLYEEFMQAIEDGYGSSRSAGKDE